MRIRTSFLVLAPAVLSSCAQEADSGEGAISTIVQAARVRRDSGTSIDTGTALDSGTSTNTRHGRKLRLRFGP